MIVSINEFKTFYDSKSHLKRIAEFIISKFADTMNIFKCLDLIGINEFISNSLYSSLNEDELIFQKGEQCTKYYFLLNGILFLNT